MVIKHFLALNITFHLKKLRINQKKIFAGYFWPRPIWGMADAIFKSLKTSCQTLLLCSTERAQSLTESEKQLFNILIKVMDECIECLTCWMTYARPPSVITEHSLIIFSSLDSRSSRFASFWCSSDRNLGESAKHSEKLITGLISGRLWTFENEFWLFWAFLVVR